MHPYVFSSGRTPLLVSIPHGGQAIPDDIAEGMTEAGRAMADNDWHLGRLYDFASERGASLLLATYSRYVIDLNRPPDGFPLYPGAHNTELCPLMSFDGAPLYQPGLEPQPEEIARRLQLYWRPYHMKLAETLAQMVRQFGVAVLFEAHSIRREVPCFFEGRLPALNLGSVCGRSAASTLVARLAARCQEAAAYDSVIDGRFIGGYITRHYGRPSEGIHAVQLELTQDCYMEEAPPFPYREDKAASLQPLLTDLLDQIIDWTTHIAEGLR